MIRLSAPPSSNLHQFAKLSALVAEHAVIVVGARDALGDGRSQDADDLHHLGEYIHLGQPAALHLVLHGELPEGRAAAGVVRQHRGAGHKGSAGVAAREDRQHRRQLAHQRDAGEGGEQGVRDELRGLDLNHLTAVRLMQMDRVGVEGEAKRCDDIGPVAIDVQQGLEEVSADGKGETIDVDHLEHATTGGNAAQGVDLAGLLERETIGVRMGVAYVHGFHRDGDAALLEDTERIGKAGIHRLPAHQAAAEAHVGALSVVRVGQRTIAVEFEQHGIKRPAHEIARQPADAKGGRAMGAGRAAHHGSDHVVEDAGGCFHEGGFRVMDEVVDGEVIHLPHAGCISTLQRHRLGVDLQRVQRIFTS